MFVKVTDKVRLSNRRQIHVVPPHPLYPPEKRSVNIGEVSCTRPQAYGRELDIYAKRSVSKWYRTHSQNANCSATSHSRHWQLRFFSVHVRELSSAEPVYGNLGRHFITNAQGCLEETLTKNGVIWNKFYSKQNFFLRRVISVMLIKTQNHKYVLDIQSEHNNIINKRYIKYQLHVSAILLAIIRLYSPLYWPSSGCTQLIM